MNPYIWLKNTIRNKVRGTLIGNLLEQITKQKIPKTLSIISATRLSEKEFWENSALGKSLKIWLPNPNISYYIQFENKEGLPAVYNSRMLTNDLEDVTLFVHDDIWLDDPKWVNKLMVALRHYDIVGVAGNTRISKNQPAWLFSKLEEGKFTWDSAYLSGTIAHGLLPRGVMSFYGPSPAKCELLDGAFIAVRTTYVRRSNLLFDEKFSFHFYDMDFCRAARCAGLSLGTWPISLTHQSAGSFGGEAWNNSWDLYRKKWLY